MTKSPNLAADQAALAAEQAALQAALVGPQTTLRTDRQASWTAIQTAQGALQAAINADSSVAPSYTLVQNDQTKLTTDQATLSSDIARPGGPRTGTDTQLRRGDRQRRVLQNMKFRYRLRAGCCYPGARIRLFKLQEFQVSKFEFRGFWISDCRLRRNRFVEFCPLRRLHGCKDAVA